MALETGTYISDLVATNPTATDPKSAGDDHLRLLKSTVKATFPNVSGAVTPTHTELNFVDGVTSAIQTQMDLKSPLASPTFTGVPAAPTAAAGTSTTQLATTAFVDTNYATKASPTFTGTPLAPTAAVGTSSTQIATTAFAAALAFSSALPAQAGNSGKFVTTDGATASWSTVDLAGNATVTSSGVNITLTSASTRLQSVTMTTTGLQVILPNATTLSEGGALFVVANTGTNSFIVKDNGTNTLAVVGSDQIATFYLADNSTAAGTWSVGNETYDGSGLNPMVSGSVTAFSAAALQGASKNISACALSDNKFIVAYKESGTTVGKAVVLDVVGNVITVGTAVTFDTVVGLSSMAALSTTKAILAYRDANADAGEAVILDVSGSTITVGASFAFSTGGIDGTAGVVVSVASLSATKAIVLYNDNSNNLDAKVLTITGSTITGGAALAVAAAATLYQSVVALSATSAVVLCHLTGTTFLNAAVLAISGTTVTSGAATALNAVASTHISGAMINSTQLIVGFVNAAANAQAFLLTVSGTTPSAGTASTFRAGAVIDISAASVNGRKIAVSYTAPTTGFIENALISAVVGDTTVTATGPNVLNAVSSGFSASAVSSAGKMITAYRNGSTTFGNSIVTEILG